MLCDNCGKREANVRYSENINGRKKELNLCEECSHKLGVDQMNFSMPIDFSNFFEGFMDNFGSNEFMPMLNELKALKCNSCGYTFDDIANTGRLGCKDCYDVFQDRLDPIIKRIQGSKKHVGRIGKIIDSRIDNKNAENIEDIEVKKPISEKEKLENELKEAIKEERYEDAARIRDEIKKID
jgi:protein arginine kinase activator